LDERSAGAVCQIPFLRYSKGFLSTPIYGSHYPEVNSIALLLAVAEDRSFKSDKLSRGMDVVSPALGSPSADRSSILDSSSI